MKRILTVAGLFAALLAAWPAAAQPSERPGAPDRRIERAGPPAPSPLPQPQRAGSFERQQPDRMSIEERRQLRRDIYDHGREVYRDRRQSDPRQSERR